MSKKSRKRNRRLAKIAGIIGGLALLGRGKGTAFPRPKEGTIDQMAANAVTGTEYPGANKVVKSTPVKVADTDSNFQTRFTAKSDDGVWRGPGKTLAYNRLRAGNKIPPSMRGGAETAEGFVRRVPISRTGRGKGAVKYGWSTQPYEKSIFGNPITTPYRPMKKGGRVKLAKRGLGRAFTKAKK